MKAIMKSVSPRICEKVANGDCTILVSKTAPKCEVPFKGYIYTTKKKHLIAIFKKGEYIFSDDHSFGKFDENIFVKDNHRWQGKVIGEFVCDKVFLLHPYTYDGGNADLRHRKLIQTFEGSSKGNEILAATCLTQDEMFDYIGAGNYGYGLHISDLKIYGKPKELSEFYTKKTCNSCKKSGYESTACMYDEDCKVPMPITSAPSNWCYVEEL